MTLMVLGAVWGLLTSTRLLRGEEDAGRWELLLAGQTTRSGRHGPGPRRASGPGSWPCGVTASTHRPRRASTARCIHRCRSDAVLLAGHGGHRRHVPAPSGPYQPAGRHPSAGGRLRGRGPGRELRPAPGRRRRDRPPRPDLGLPARMGRGAPPLTAPRPAALLPIVAFTAAVARAAVRLAGAVTSAPALADRSSSGRMCACCRARPASPPDWSGPPSSAGGRPSPLPPCSTA